MYFTGAENPGFVLEAVRFWAEEFHVDGIHLVGPVNGDLIGRDPYFCLLYTSSGDMADLLKDVVSSTFIQNFELDEVTILVNGEAA